MDIRLGTGNPDSYCHISTSNRPNRSYFCKLDLLLRLGHLKQPFLPFVIGLLTDAVFPAPGFDILAAVATLRDPSSPQGQFVLTVECL